jgi:hypothetical protein
MLKARIFKPSKTAMQSGRGEMQSWILEVETAKGKAPESLMGWTAAGDTLEQVRLKFDTLEEARRYADEKGYVYMIDPVHERKVKPRNYGDNFRYVPHQAAEEKKS